MRIGQFQTIDPAGNSVLDLSYQYDTLGNIETKTTEHGSYSYDYDAMSRLTAAANPVLDDEAYTYDAVGNRLTAGGVSGSITHNQNNELRVYGDITYDYDPNGNLTEVRANDEVVWTYVYDAANRLVHVEDSSGNISADYYYDPFGRRLWKDVRRSAAQSLQRTYFFYSDEGLIAEYDGNGQELRAYGYKPDSTWTTDPLWLKQQGAYYWYQNDHLGTPQKLVAVNGAVVWSAQYSAFGEAQVQVETVVNNLRFPGQYFDAETGLHYNFQRYYEPGIGRYLRVDPVRFAGGAVNLYEYVMANPTNAFDPHGLDVYVAQRPLDMFLTFDVSKWRTPIKRMLLTELFGLYPDTAAVLSNSENLLTILNWYAHRTRHCAVVILTRCDKKLLRQYTGGRDDELRISNLAFWGLLEDVRQKYSADFNDKGINIPASDFQQNPFPIEKYQYNTEVIKVIDGHDYDELVQQSMINQYVLATQYKITDSKRFNCCDWAKKVVDVALTDYKIPNPAPFGPQSGAPFTVDVALGDPRSLSKKLLPATEVIQTIFETRLDPLIYLIQAQGCNSADCLKRYRQQNKDPLWWQSPGFRN